MREWVYDDDDDDVASDVEIRVEALVLARLNAADALDRRHRFSSVRESSTIRRSKQTRR